MVDETGNRYGRLVVLRLDTSKVGGGARWLCLCDCGASVVVVGKSLRKGDTRSCGCFQKEKARVRGQTQVSPTTRHGHCRSGRKQISPTWKSWIDMVQRCTNSNRRDYGRYGGRGITVCDRWLTFENFLADMGERPTGMTLDRKDNEKGYEPGNCRWATAIEQANNKRANTYYQVGGTRMSMADWARHFGVKYTWLQYRIKALGFQAIYDQLTATAERSN